MQSYLPYPLFFNIVRFFILAYNFSYKIELFNFPENRSLVFNSTQL